ncbi:chaperone protein ClpB1 [Oryza brachyantha]|nr:chaperone protein ClpB1 [Oryza brachyantha]
MMEALVGRKSIEEAIFLVVKEAQKYFKPEFVSRLTEVVIFKPLSISELKEIASIQLKAMAARVAEKGITLTTSDAALDVILHKSHNLSGGRSVRRLVKKIVTTKLSEMLVKGEVEEGTIVTIDATQDRKELKYNVLKKAAPSEHQFAESSSRRAAGKMPAVVEISSDDDSDSDVAVAAPMAKRMKGATIRSSLCM